MRLLSTGVRHAFLGAALALGLAARAAAQQPGAPAPAQPSAPALTSERPTVVVGTVVDRSTHNPVPAATILLPEQGRKAVADVHGQFVLPNVEPGEMTAFVGRIGYARKQETWLLDGGDTTQVLVSLAPDAIALSEMKVIVDRLDARVRASGWAARTVRLEELQTTTSPNATEFVFDHFGLTPVRCGLATGGAAKCVRVRGATIRPCVVIDEVPASSGLSELATYRAQDLYRVDVYRGGSFIQAYTTAFMQNSAQRPWNPMPVEAQYISFCGTANRDQ